MKKIIGLVTVLAVMLSLTACGSNVEEAHLKGYDEPLHDVLEEAIAETMEEEESFDIEWSDGWDHENAPDEDRVGKGEKAVTCKVTWTDEEGNEVCENYFFFAYDKKEEELTPKGSVSIEEGYVQEDSAKETKEILESLYE